MLAASVTAAANLMAEGVLLVVPANQILVDLGFDLMRMKPAGTVEMICYSGADEVQTLELFDRGQWRWREIPQSTWVNGTLRNLSKDALVIVGEGRAARDLLDTASWAGNILTPDGHALHELANAVHSVSPLTRKQWKALEKGYGITYREIAAPSRYERGDRYSRRERDVKPAKQVVTGSYAPAAATSSILQQEPPELDLSVPTVVVVTEEAPAAEAPAQEAPAPAPEAPAKTVQEAAATAQTVIESAPAAAKEAVKEAAQDAAEDVRKTVEAAEEKAQDVAASANETAGEAAVEVKRTVQEALDKAKAEVEGVGAALPPAVAAPEPPVVPAAAE